MTELRYRLDDLYDTGRLHRALVVLVTLNAALIAYIIAILTLTSILR